MTALYARKPLTALLAGLILLLLSTSPRTMRFDTFTVGAVPSTGTVIISKATVDGEDTFGFFGTGAGIPTDFDITTVGGIGGVTFAGIAAGPKTVMESTPPTGWALTGLDCTDPDGGTTVDAATRTATIDLDPGETITCTFTDEHDMDGDAIADRLDLCPTIPDVSCAGQVAGLAVAFTSTPEKARRSSTDGTSAKASHQPGILVSDFATDQVFVFVATPDGTFERNRPIAVGDGPVALATGDFNRDGRMDVITANLLSDSLTLVEGKDDGSFGRPREIFLFADQPRAVAVGDLNFDDYLDIAIANAQSNDVTILLGKSKGRFDQLGNIPIQGIRPSAIVMADLNNDEYPDVAVTNLISDDVSILIGNGTGAFTETQRIPVGRRPVSIAVADFDRDGRRDLATANFHSNTISILFSRVRGRASTYFRVDQFVGERPSFIVPDEYAIGKLGVATTNFVSGDVSLIFSREEGGFEREKRFPATFQPHLMVTGDFNSDGMLDIVVVGFPFGNIWTLQGTEAGRFKLKKFF